MTIQRNKLINLKGITPYELMILKNKKPYTVGYKEKLPGTMEEG